MGILETIVFYKSSTLFWVSLSSMESCAPKKHVRLQSRVEKNTKALCASKRFRPTLKNLKDKMCIYLLQDKKDSPPYNPKIQWCIYEY